MHYDMHTLDGSSREEYEAQAEKNSVLEKEVESLQEELSKKQGQRGKQKHHSFLIESTVK